MHLWEVLVEDDLVKDAQAEIQEILEKNLNVVEQAIHVYDDYLFLLKEKPRIEQFLSEPNYSREQFKAEIKKFEDTITSIREKMPYEIRMNMFLIDCVDLNEKLVEDCEDLIRLIVEKTSFYTFQERANNIITNFKQIQEGFATKADSSKVLVKMEKELEDVKNQKKGQLISDYRELIEWLNLLYETRKCRVEEEQQIKPIITAYGSIQKISQLIETFDTNLKNQRTEIENRLQSEKKVFSEMLQEIKAEVEKFRDYDQRQKREEYNKTIASIQSKLVELSEEKVKINDQEQDLDITPSEYPLIDECKRDILPFEELWGLVRDKLQRTDHWLNSPLEQLDPEMVEKDHKQMLQVANKLVNNFQARKVPKGEKIANDMKHELMNFREYLPII